MTDFDLIYQGTTTCKRFWEEVSMMPKYVLLEYHSFGQYPRITISMATAKLAKFLQNIRWESCLKLNFEQLSHSMFSKNIASLAVAMETCDPWILAKRAIFLQNILWESCSKFYFKHFCYNMFYLNIISLAVIMIIRF